MDVRERLNRIFNRGQEFSVAASPFNPVKLDLAIIIAVAIIYLLVVMKAVDDEGVQFLLLAGYGFAAAIFLIWRVRRIVSKEG